MLCSHGWNTLIQQSDIVSLSQNDSSFQERQVKYTWLRLLVSKHQYMSIVIGDSVFMDGNTLVNIGVAYLQGNNNPVHLELGIKLSDNVFNSFQ